MKIIGLFTIIAGLLVFGLLSLFFFEVWETDRAYENEKKARIALALSDYPTYLETKTQACQAIVHGSRALSRRECECLINKGTSLPRRDYKADYITEAIESLKKRDKKIQVSNATLANLFFSGDLHIQYDKVVYDDAIAEEEEDWYYAQIQSAPNKSNIRIDMARAGLSVFIPPNKLETWDEKHYGLSSQFIRLFHHIAEVEAARAVNNATP